MMVDIIVPIYNAYEDLVKCVSSIWRHTDLKKNRLILVNDKSTDERIVPYLESVSGGNIIVHNSVQNGGFSASVNIGMQYSEENDALLLNSDTIVTAGWLEKIMACAYSEDNIGTVIPLSNSATIASIPVIGQDNPVPSNVTIDQYAEIVEKCSLKRYPQITVAVGFCMYIKRKLIKEIGYFDAETFQRGYGEENDFCCRAELAGYKHVLCDNAFVYHKGTASFEGEQKKALMEEHVRILEYRYPASMRKNHLFCMSRPFSYVRDNISMYVQLFNGKKNMLYVVHADFRKDASNNVGGTQLHVKDLKERLIDRYNIYVLAKEEGIYRLSCYVDDSLYTFEFTDESVNSYMLFRDARENKVLENIITAFRIDLIHIHHISRMSLEIYYTADRLGIPVVTSIHDFFTLCPTYFLYNLKEENCMGHETGLCRDCLVKKTGIWGGKIEYIDRWRQEMENAVRSSRAIVFPSHSARKVFDSVYDIDTIEQVIGHGLDADGGTAAMIEKYIDVEDRITSSIDAIDLTEDNSIVGWAFLHGTNSARTKIIVQILQGEKIIQQVTARKHNREDVDVAFGKKERYIQSGFCAKIMKNLIEEEKADVRVLLAEEEDVYLVQEIKDVPVHQEKTGEGTRVAFIGGLSDIKGSRTVCDMVKKAADVEWYIFGDIDPREELHDLELPNLHKFGFYNREDIGLLLKSNRIDAVCIMSRSSETFCYTLSEAWEAKLPVLAYDLGAVGERIQETGAGIVVPADAGTEEILDKIRNIPNGEEWKRARKQLENYKHKTTGQMAEEYAGLYESLFGSEEKEWNSWNTEMIKNAYRGKEKL